MDPDIGRYVNQGQVYGTGPTNHRRRAQLLAIALVAVFLLLILYIGFSLHKTQQFHVVNTDPSTGNVANVAPFLKVNFNENLAKAVSVSSSPSIIQSNSVSGKTLTLNLKTPLNVNTTYTITLHSVSDTAGKRITNKVFTFKPVSANWGDLSSEQQHAILKKQEQGQSAPNVQPPNFAGTDSLIDNGLSTTQVQAYQQDIESFAQQQKIKLTAAVIDTSSITPGPLDGSGTFSLVFNVSINNKSYKVTAKYNDPTAIELLLFDGQSGVQVYDSGSAS